MTRKIVNYLQEVRAELEKVTWPEKKVLKITTLVVVFFMILMALYIGIVDVIFSKLVSIFIR